VNRRRAGLLIALAAVVLGGALWLLLGGGEEKVAAPEAPAASAAGPSASTPVAPAQPAAPLETWTAKLYFPAANDRLVVDEREIASGEAPGERAAALVATLLATSPPAPRVPVFPIAVEAGRVLLLEDATLLVDLRSSESADPPASGSTIELLRVYAVVHTLLRNIPEATQVVLLWNGRQRPSFAGHVDTSRPLRTRADLDSPSRPAPAGEAEASQPEGAQGAPGDPP
jgi:hypothetical protein